MKQFETLPINRLVNDVAVDPVHVRELADSIKVSGPISPVMVREGSHELIDGFHRVAAMQELGFTHVECILTPCDEETFWDLRIMSASLHKSVAFARAADWVEECFRVSPWASKYKSAYVLFVSGRQNNVAPEAQSWMLQKSQAWGLSPRTIEEWLYTKQSLAPEVLNEASSSREQTNDVSFTQLRDIARSLPNRQELQKRVLEKAQTEGLNSNQTREVAQAVAKARDPGLVEGILLQPVSRSADELTRSAVVERIKDAPKHTAPPQAKQRELTGIALDVYLSLEQQIHNVGRLNDTVLAELTPRQRDRINVMLTDLLDKLHDLQDRLSKSTRGLVVEGQLVTRE